MINFRTLCELEVRKQWQIKISNRLAALEDLNDSEDINRAWDNIKERITILDKESLGLCELKQHKPWCDEKKLRSVYQRSRLNTVVQFSGQSNVDNLNNVRCETSRQFTNIKKEYLKDEIEHLETNSKMKNIKDFYRGINGFKKGYHSL